MQIDEQKLVETVKKLLTKGKGILAADESNGTADKRLESFGIATGEEMRKKFRHLFLCMPGVEEYLSGVILYDETFWQDNCDGVSFRQSLSNLGILPGIKVDLGAKDMPGFPDEKLTVGLDDLADRAKRYFDAGAKFTKWRAVIKIDAEKNLPTTECITANAEALARYARIVQEIGLVPIIEPEVLLDGKHDLKTSEKITTIVVSTLFEKLAEAKVFLPGLILKTSMVINGNQNSDEASPEEVADATVRMLKKSVPSEVGGIVFLSGGQTAVEATAHLDAIAEQEPLPWEIAFSFARALQESALRIWAGKDENIASAREEFLKRLKLNKLADEGKYDIALEYLD